MQGYILNTVKVKDEDLIVSILTKESHLKAYRFYGVRHPNINIGYKIDFELEQNYKSKLPRLKEVINLGFSWIVDLKKMVLWQNFIKLLYKHLFDIEKVDKFYFDMLEELVKRIEVQDFKRAIVEVYVKLLEFEGRLHNEFICLLCEEKIIKKTSLVRGFFPTHPNCSLSFEFDIKKINYLFSDKTALYLNKDEVDYLYDLVMQGL